MAACGYNNGRLPRLSQEKRSQPCREEPIIKEGLTAECLPAELRSVTAATAVLTPNSLLEAFWLNLILERIRQGG